MATIGEASRAFWPSRPTPTAFQHSERVARLVALLAALQFILNGLNNLVTGLPMFSSWLVAAILVGLSTLRIERYFARRRRLEQR